jgi:hypothetical protein
MRALRSPPGMCGEVQSGWLSTRGMTGTDTAIPKARTAGLGKRGAAQRGRRKGLPGVWGAAPFN